jgi:hypothetical protein
MDGVDLVTEGTMTLARVAELLERGAGEPKPGSPAGDFARVDAAGDVVHFLVGTRINEAHQDPNVPVELDLRRNIVRRIAALLESRHLKETRRSSFERSPRWAPPARRAFPRSNGPVRPRQPPRGPPWGGGISLPRPGGRAQASSLRWLQTFWNALTYCSITSGASS